MADQIDQNICRLCNANIGVTSLFDTVKDGIPLSAIVMYFAKVTIVHGDGLPANICECCEHALESAYRFVLKCEQTDHQFRSLQLTLKLENEAEVEHEENLEHEVKPLVEVKIEALDNFESCENIFEDLCDFPPLDDITEDVPKVRMKHKDIPENVPKERTKCADITEDAPKLTTKHKHITEDIPKVTTKRKDVTEDVSEVRTKCEDITEDLSKVRTKSKYITEDVPKVRTKSKDITEDVFKVRMKRKYVRKKPKKVGPVKCNICGCLSKHQSALTAHMKTHSNIKPYTCPSCDKRYKDSGTLKRHMERNHNERRERTFMCELCGKSFFTKSDCKIHTRTHTGETPYACTKCPARFTQTGSLQRHTLTHTGEKPHMCSKCGKKFPTKGQLQVHYLVHTNERKHKCPLCNMMFKTSNSKLKHLKLHNNTIHKNFTCNDCGYTSFSKGNLRSHIQRQHSSKSGYCSKCSKHVPNLEMHMWKHAGLRTVECQFCSNRFFDLKGLARHVSIRHASPDKFECTVKNCTVKFPTRPMLDYHVVRYHKETKPFSCDTCPRRFYRKSDMVRHQKGTHKQYMEVPVTNK